MSNCVEIVGNSRIKLDNKRFDIIALLMDLNKVPVDRQQIAKDDYATDFKWWFVKFNTLFHDDYAIIDVGKGKSTHTWRDLKGLFMYLSEFVRPEYKDKLQVSFRMRDEYDGFRKTFTTTFKISKDQQ